VESHNRATASQIACSSATSFLFVIAQGVANCIDISRTVSATALYAIIQLHAFGKKLFAESMPFRMGARQPTREQAA